MEFNTQRILIVDEKWYKNIYHLDDSISASKHYHSIGWKEGKSPNPYFDGEKYLKRYPDVKESGMDPLLHYKLHGQKEGRERYFFETLFVKPQQKHIEKKRIAFCGAMNSPDLDLVKLNTPAGQKKVGLNTGNFIIGEYGRSGIKTFLSPDEIRFPRNINISPEEFNEKYDHLVIFAANWLAHYMKDDFSAACDWLEKIKTPVTLIGLGAQHPMRSFDTLEYVKTLNPSLIRMIKIISQKGYSISTRGFVTADLLSALGIKNVNVTGCPTWFVRGHNQGMIQKKSFNEIRNVAMHSDRDFIDAYSTLFRLTKNCDKQTFILQSEFDFIPLMQGNQETISNVSQRYRLSEEILKDADKFRMFGSMNLWENFIRMQDLVIGLRIHGTIIALKNNIPAILFYHDGRTFEFVDVFDLPKFHISELFKSDLILKNLYDKIDFTPMNKKYHFLLSNYKQFLQDNNLMFNGG